MFYVAGAVYLLYLSILVLRAYSELRSMPYFGEIFKKLLIHKSYNNFLYHINLDMRLKFLSLLMLFVMSITVTVTMGRFGFGVLEDNFVANLSTTYKSSAEFMCFYGLLNFYLFTMAYVYSPDEQTQIEPRTITKDNPGKYLTNLTEIKK